MAFNTASGSQRSTASGPWTRSHHGDSMRARFLLFLAVIASALPNCSKAQQVPDGSQNLPPFGSFSGSDFDIVSLQNGNVHIEIPILTLKQRQGTVHRSYVYDTPSFTLTEDIEVVQGRRTRQFIVEQNNLLFGWHLTNQANWGITASSITETCTGTVGAVGLYALIDPQGTKHPLNLHTGGCKTPIQILLKDGTMIHAAVTTNLEDTNGDLSTTATDNLGRTPLTVADASPITYTSPWGHGASGPAYTTWTVLDSGGNQRTFRLDYTLVDFATSFCGTPATSPCTNFNSWCLFPAK